MAPYFDNSQNIAHAVGISLYYNILSRETEWV